MPRLPSSANVPQVQQRSDPGVNVPGPAPLEAFGSSFEPEAFQQLAEAAQRMRTRASTVEAAGAIGTYLEEARKARRDLETESDLAAPGAGEQFGKLLEERKNNLLANFSGDPDTRARLAVRLIDIQSSEAAQFGEQVASAQRARVSNLMNDQISEFTANAIADPSGISSLYASWDGVIADMAPALTAEDEEMFRDAGRQQVTISALNTMLARGDVAGARELIEIPGVPQMLTPEQQTSVARTFAQVEAQRTAAVREAQDKLLAFETLVGRPANAYERMKLAGVTPTAGRRTKSDEIREIEVALGRPLSPEEKAKQLGVDLGSASTDAGKTIEDRERLLRQYGEGSEQVAAFDAATSADEPADLTDVGGMRKEFTNLSKPFIATRDAYMNIRNIEPTAAGDMSLVFAFMKMLDPGSTVREGEQASAQNAAGVPARVMNTYNRVLTGETLTPAQREDFKNQAENIMLNALGAQRQNERQFGAIAARSNLPPEDVVIDFVGDLGLDAGGSGAGGSGAGGSGTGGTGGGGPPPRREIIIQYDLTGKRVTP